MLESACAPATAGGGIPPPQAVGSRTRAGLGHSGGPETVWKAVEGLLRRQCCRRLDDLTGHPVGEWRLDLPMCTRSGVYLLNRSEPRRWDSIADSHEGWPHPTMDERDLAVHQAQANDIRRVGQLVEDRLLNPTFPHRWGDAPGMNRTCARGLGTSVRKRYLQGKVRLSASCAPVNAPVL
jgi:hypothetical protein